MTMIQHLFVYGTLAPGKEYSHLVEQIKGQWSKAEVTGKHYPNGTSTTGNYPAIELDVNGERIHGFIYSSNDFGKIWQQLDEFEGPAYQRERTQALKNDGSIVNVFVYTLKK